MYILEYSDIKQWNGSYTVYIQLCQHTILLLISLTIVLVIVSNEFLEDICFYCVGIHSEGWCNTSDVVMKNIITNYSQIDY